MNQQSNPEEIDVLQFFSAFGKMFRDFFRGLKNWLIKLFYVFIDGLLYLKKNIIYLTIGVLAGLALSFVGKKSTNSYYAQAMLRTNYDAQLSLLEKAGIINDLIEKEKIEQLARFLQIDTTQAAHLKGIELNPVIDDALLLNDYENFLKTKDTVVYKFFEFEDFKNNYKKNTELNNYWRIRVFADNPSAFNNFNTIFKNLFKNEKAINKRKENYVSALTVSKAKILQSLKEIDSLRNLYNTVLLENAKKPVSATGIIVGSDKPKGPEAVYNLFDVRRAMLRNLQEINIKINQYNDAIVMLNNFPEYGIKERLILKNNYVKYGLYGFLLVLFILLLKDFNVFLSHYEQRKKSNQAG